MKAIILVAGREEKLSPLTDEMHQCLFKINDKTVIEMILDRLKAVGINDVVLVVGHKSETIMDFLKDRYNELNINYVINEDFESTNVIYSLWLARSHTENGFILIDGDVIWESELIEKLINSDEKNVLLMDFDSKFEADDMKAKVVKNRIVSMGKELAPKSPLEPPFTKGGQGGFGEFIGLSKFSPECSKIFMNKVNDLVNQGKVELYYEDALNQILSDVEIASIDVKGFNWIEIDNIDEFEKSKKIFGDVLHLKRAALDLGATQAFAVLPDDVIFDDRAKLQCFNCRNYNKKLTCPPNIPDLNYKEMISRYIKGLLVVVKMEFSEETFERVRMESTNKLHNILLKLEKIAFNQDNYFTTSFIGGSCKLCPDGCSSSCRYPEKARIPVEALGINVVKTVKRFGLELKFPVKDYLYRIGLLMVG